MGIEAGRVNSGEKANKDSDVVFLPSVVKLLERVEGLKTISDGENPNELRAEIVTKIEDLRELQGNSGLSAQDIQGLAPQIAKLNVALEKVRESIN